MFVLGPYAESLSGSNTILFGSTLSLLGPSSTWVVSPFAPIFLTFQEVQITALTAKGGSATHMINAVSGAAGSMTAQSGDVSPAISIASTAISSRITIEDVTVTDLNVTAGDVVFMHQAI